MLNTSEQANPDTSKLISIVVPVYNEEESIPLLYGKIRVSQGFVWELIMLNDGFDRAHRIQHIF